MKAVRKGGFYRRILLVACAVALSLRALWVGVDAIADTHRPMAERRRQPTVAATHYERYASLKQHIAPKRGIIGFVTQNPTEADALGRYAIARYALAPLVITNSTDSATIIADFPSPRALDAYAQQHRFQVRLYDATTGLAILNNPERYSR
jgi:hypothetical protein